jgi:hypothetical protein
MTNWAVGGAVGHSPGWRHHDLGAGAPIWGGHMAETDDREHEAAKRLDAFVDAAFAFAVTLLVIAGAEGPSSLTALGAAMGRIPASLGAFVLIAMFWLAYRDFGRMAPRRDSLSSLNGLAIVFVVLVYVFPLRMLVESGFVWISGGRLPGEVIIHTLGDLRLLFRVYGLGFVTAGRPLRHPLRPRRALAPPPGRQRRGRGHGRQSPRSGSSWPAAACCRPC